MRLSKHQNSPVNKKIDPRALINIQLFFPRQKKTTKCRISRSVLVLVNTGPIENFFHRCEVKLRYRDATFLINQSCALALYTTRLKENKNWKKRNYAHQLFSQNWF